MRRAARPPYIGTDMNVKKKAMKKRSKTVEADREKLFELRKQVAINAPLVDRTPYAHNIINFTLLEIAEKFGKAEANKAIHDFKLKKLGWVEEPEERKSNKQPRKSRKST
jgi:hypothetical protein